MNIIDTSQITDPATEQPFTGQSLAFLQAATMDSIRGIIAGLVGTSYLSTIPYAVWGIQFVGAMPATVTQGFIFWNNELFFCQGRPTPILTAGVVNIVVTNPAPDPLIFTDGSAKNVHNVRRARIDDGVPGTGDFDLLDVVFLPSLTALLAAVTIPAWTNLALSNSWANSTIAKVRKMFDRVQLVGIITNATLANATLTAFTLPVGSRPAVDTYIPMIVSNNGVFATNNVYVQASGLFTIDTTGFANVTTTVYLNGVSFVTT